MRKGECKSLCEFYNITLSFERVKCVVHHVSCFYSLSTLSQTFLKLRCVRFLGFNLFWCKKVILGGGKTIHHLPQWESLTSDPWILKQDEGVWIQFKEIQEFVKDWKEIRFLDHEVKWLNKKLKHSQRKGSSTKQAILQVRWCQTFFSEKKRTWTQRAILYLKSLNKNVKKNHFKMDGWKMQ